MKLKNPEEQIQFLTECYEHMQRMFLSTTTEAEKRLVDNKLINLEKSQILIADNAMLPLTITFTADETVKDSLKANKLAILSEVYNRAAKNLNNKQQTIDLDETFLDVKREATKVNFTKDWNEIMQTHRSKPESLFMRFLAWLFPPASQKFLNKYEFFESKQTTPLLEAINKQDVALVRKLAKNNPLLVNRREDYDTTYSPLVLAASKDNLEMVSILVDNGAVQEINIQEDTNFSYMNKDREALRYAVERSNLELVKKIMEAPVINTAKEQRDLLGVLYVAIKKLTNAYNKDHADTPEIARLILNRYAEEGTINTSEIKRMQNIYQMNPNKIYRGSQDEIKANAPNILKFLEEVDEIDVRQNQAKNVIK